APTARAAPPQRPQGPPGGGGLPGGMGGPPGMGRRGDEQLKDPDKELVAEEIRVRELNDKAKVKIMELPLPARMVVITGEFPYRDQMEACARALRFPSAHVMLNDPDVVIE